MTQQETTLAQRLRCMFGRCSVLLLPPQEVPPERFTLATRCVRCGQLRALPADSKRWRRVTAKELTDAN